MDILDHQHFLLAEASKPEAPYQIVFARIAGYQSHIDLVSVGFDRARWQVCPKGYWVCVFIYVYILVYE